MGKFDEGVGAEIVSSEGVLARLIKRALEAKFDPGLAFVVESVDSRAGTYVFYTTVHQGTAVKTTRWRSTYRVVSGVVEIDDDFPEGEIK